MRRFSVGLDRKALLCSMQMQLDSTPFELWIQGKRRFLTVGDRIAARFADEFCAPSPVCR
jgi:hypothetical protein